MIYQIIALIIWGSAFISAKYAQMMLDPILLVQFRLTIAAIIVAPMALRHVHRIKRPSWKPLIAMAFLNYVAVLFLQFKGLQYTSASSAVTILGLEPLIVVFLGHFFFKDKAKSYHWFCGLLAFIGVITLIAGGHGAEIGGEISLLGCFLVFLGSITFACILRPTQALLKNISASSYSLLSLLFAPFLALPFTAIFTQTWEIHWNTQGVLGLLYLGICCNWLAYWLWNKGMDSVPANLSGLLAALEPIFGVAMAVLLLHEQITWISWIGIGIVTFSTVLATILPRFEKKAAVN
ncbi:DMT family transporter [Kingella negevensis]|uniref:DMT family transporter n=1 Tax=Kingella negevensis TaxID=1522312 RepID=UPI00050A1EC2|nr:DMT family transporter [Kingella negevensis]MDK4688173.1 DMT family transporter [Kingella negevensis]WII90842.1 DMT family transporter [Kingella negevensis]